jgi:hypothetical protein
MRWGINNEVTDTHMTTTICLNEIKICQQSRSTAHSPELSFRNKIIQKQIKLSHVFSDRIYRYYNEQKAITTVTGLF